MLFRSALTNTLCHRIIYPNLFYCSSTYIRTCLILAHVEYFATFAMTCCTLLVEGLLMRIYEYDVTSQRVFDVRFQGRSNWYWLAQYLCFATTMTAR